MKTNITVLLLCSIVLLSACTTADFLALSNKAGEFGSSSNLNYEISIPEEFEIISTDFENTSATKVSSINGRTSSSINQLSFLKVYARNVKTKEESIFVFRNQFFKYELFQIIKINKVSKEEFLEKINK